MYNSISFGLYIVEISNATCIFRKNKERIRYLYFNEVCGRWVKHQRVFAAPKHESVLSSNGFRCIFVCSLIVFSALFFPPYSLEMSYYGALNSRLSGQLVDPW